MEPSSIVQLTGQRWKIWLLYSAIALAVGSTLWFVVTQASPVQRVATLFLSYAAFAVVSLVCFLTIRCPACSGRFFWQVAKDSNAWSWLPVAKATSQCPLCAWSSGCLSTFIVESVEWGLLFSKEPAATIPGPWKHILSDSSLAPGSVSSCFAVVRFEQSVGPARALIVVFADALRVKSHLPQLREALESRLDAPVVLASNDSTGRVDAEPVQHVTNEYTAAAVVVAKFAGSFEDISSVTVTLGKVALTVRPIVRDSRWLVSVAEAAA